MKYFFLIKEEHALETYGENRGLITEEQIKDAIQRNQIGKYRKVPAFKNGSKVQLVDYRPHGWNDRGGMDCYKNKILTVRGFTKRGISFVEDTGLWSFRISDIATTIEY